MLQLKACTWQIVWVNLVHIEGTTACMLSNPGIFSCEVKGLWSSLCRDAICGYQGRLQEGRQPQAPVEGRLPSLHIECLG